MRIITENTFEYSDLIRIKDNIVNRSFDDFPKMLLRKDLKFALPTIMTFTSKDEDSVDNILTFLKKICFYYKQNSFYIVPVFSDMSIAGAFKENSSKDIVNMYSIEVHSIIGEMHIYDSPAQLIELFALPQFDPVICQGYFAFDKSSDWVMLDSEPLETTVFFSTGSLPQKLATSFLDNRYLLSREDFVANLNYSYDLEKVRDFEEFYFSRFYFLEDFGNNVDSK